jgi:predicted nucleotidyltransferase
MVFDLAGLLRSLSDAEVEFIVIAGIAVAAHSVVRATEDLDVVPNPDAINLSKLLDLLEAQEARLVLNPQRRIDGRVRQAVLRGRNLTVTTELGDLDVQRLPGVPSYADLARDAMLVELHGVRFRVCSREHLIAMKRARGSALDKADLERLTS